MNTQAVPDSHKVPGERKGRRWLLWLLTFTLILAAGAGGWWYAHDQGNKDKAVLQKQLDDLKAQVAKTEKEAKTTTFTEMAFSLKVPLGWVKDDTVKLPSYRYADADGNYFTVEVDPPGHGISADRGWVLAKNSGGDGVKISSEGSTCLSEDETGACPPADGMLLIAASLGGATSEENMLKGHAYFFYFGNSKKETGVDLKVFRDILTSFKAK